MNINASAESVRAAGAAIGRASLFDDRITDGDAGRIAAWAEALDPFGFDQADVLAGVTKHYQAQNAPTIKVGDLIASARELRRQRAEKEKGESAAAATPPPNAAIGGLPIASADGKPIAAAYAINGAIDIACPRCQSEAGTACWNGTTKRDRKIPCLERVRAARRSA
jgi:hypothetical protein